MLFRDAEILYGKKKEKKVRKKRALSPTLAHNVSDMDHKLLKSYKRKKRVRLHKYNEIHMLRLSKLKIFCKYINYHYCFFFTCKLLPLTDYFGICNHKCNVLPSISFQQILTRICCVL